MWLWISRSVCVSVGGLLLHVGLRSLSREELLCTTVPSHVPVNVSACLEIVKSVQNIPANLYFHTTTHNHTQPHTITHNHTQPHTTTHKYTQPHTITHSHTQQILTHMSRLTAPLCIDNSSLILSFCSSHLFCCPSLYCISRASTLSVSLSLSIYMYMCVYHTHMCISCTSPFCPLCDFLCLFAVVRT